MIIHEHFKQNAVELSDEMKEQVTIETNSETATEELIRTCECNSRETKILFFRKKRKSLSVLKKSIKKNFFGTVNGS